MPRLYTNPFRWAWVARVCMGFYLIVITFFMWSGAPAGNYLSWVYLLFMSYIALSYGRYMGAYVLLEDILALPGNGLAVRYVPLTMVQVQRGWLGWTFRWKDGHGNQAVRCAIPAVLHGPLEEAMASRPEHPAQTSKEAVARVRVATLAANNRWMTGWLLLLVIAAMAGVGPWHTPIPFAVVAILALFVPVDAYPTVLAWTGETLWILRHKAEPYAISLEQVTEMRTSQSKGSRIMTTDPAYPEIRLAPGDNEFVKAFERRLSGEPEPAPAHGADHVLRCSLCGTPAPGIAQAEGAGVYVCDTCGTRARLEASETGHGLAAKDPKPM